jgi:hypothetical protein
MALKKIRIVWSTPPLPGGRWRLGLFNFQRIDDPARPAVRTSAATAAYWEKYLHHALHVSARGLLAWSAGLAVVAYFAGAAILLQRLERGNPHNRVTYLDLALPSRWSELDRLRGEGFIALGRERLQRGEFAAGFSLLRLGLDRHPADQEARLHVARLYVTLRLRAQAEKVLRDGLAFGYPGRDSLELAFALAADGDRPDEGAAVARLARERFLALPPAERPAGEALWLDQQVVRALLAADHPDEALALIEQSYPENHTFRREVTLARLLDTGRSAEAAALAERWAAEEPRAPEPLRLLVRARRQLGDPAATDAALARLRALAPSEPDALLYALAQHHLAGRADAAAAALEELLFRHGATAGVYATAASIFVEMKHEPGLDRLERELAERGMPPQSVLWGRLQLGVATADWRAVLRHAASLRSAPGPALPEARAAWLETATHLAHACLEGASGTQASLVEIVADRQGTLRLYRLVLEALLAAGRPATARQILTLAEGPYPEARSVVDLRGRIETALAAAAPTPDLAPVRREAPPELGSAETLLAALEQRIHANDTEGALELLAATRRARPGWLAAAEPRLDALELPVRARGADPLRLQLLARSLLARDPEGPARLLALARELMAENTAHRAHATLLLKEIVRHAPDHTEALAQLAAWQPPRRGLAPLDTAP